MVNSSVIRDIHFKTQKGPVAKNATPRPPAGNWTRDPGSLDQRSTDWATEDVAANSVYIYIYIYVRSNAGEVYKVILKIIYLSFTLVVNADGLFKVR